MKAKIEFRSDTLRVMFPHASPLLIRQAVYGGHYVNLDGEFVGRLPNYLKNTLRDARIAEELVRPRGDVPPPNEPVHTRVRRNLGF